MNELEGRVALMITAKKWLGTPYREGGAICQAGANCAMLMWGIYRDAGVLPPDFTEPRWYSSQIHVHSPEERLIANIKRCGGVQISEAELKPGDVVAYLNGKSHGHLAMVIEWPRKVIQSTKLGGCQYAHGTGGQLSGNREYFTIWPPENGAASKT